MMPSTLVRALRPISRGPFTFVGLSSFHLEKDERPVVTGERVKPSCVAREDDGRVCGLPGRYIDFNLGGHVCMLHRPDRKKDVLCLAEGS